MPEPPRTTTDTRTRPQREARLLIALLASLLGHALVLTATTRTPPAAPPHLNATARLAVRLSAAPRAHADPVQASASAPRPRKAEHPTAIAVKRDPATPTARWAPADTPPPPVPIDLDAARAEARQFARQPPSSVSVEKGKPSPSPVPPLSADEAHAALPALARQLQRPLERAVETLLADGTRRLRFTGKCCLDLPRELPLAQQSSFGETLRVATNCPELSRAHTHGKEDNWGQLIMPMARRRMAFNQDERGANCAQSPLSAIGQKRPVEVVSGKPPFGQHWLKQLAMA